MGRSEAPGQRRRVAVVRPTGPPPRAPDSGQSSTTLAPSGCRPWAAGGGGYAADRSSTADDWSELLSSGSGLGNNVLCCDPACTSPRRLCATLALWVARGAG